MVLTSHAFSGFEIPYAWFQKWNKSQMYYKYMYTYIYEYAYSFFRVDFQSDTGVSFHMKNAW